MRNSHIVCFDIEATGTDVGLDHIVQFAALKYSWEDLKSSGAPRQLGEVSFLCNPGVKMCPEVIAIHGITNEEVANLPRFEVMARRVHAFIDGCSIVGYNAINYDIPLLWEELSRTGIHWDLTDILIVDPSNIFRKKDGRTLADAVRKYCNREHEGAHSAYHDARATMDVLRGQLVAHRDLAELGPAQLAEFCRMDNRVDLSGKLVRNEAGEVVYNIGKAKGTRVRDNPSFGYWMLGKDFPRNTKEILEHILEAPNPAEEP